MHWLLIGLLVFFTASASAQPRKGVAMAKLNASLVLLHEQYTSHLTQRNVLPFSSQDRSVRVVQHSVVIDAIAAGDVGSLRSDLVYLGMTDAVAFGRTVSGHLPISSIPALAALTGLRFAQPATVITHSGTVTTQGDQAMRSNLARSTLGVDGTGVKVGVLSDSFNCLGGAAADLASGDLTSVTVLQEIASCTGANDEGRAMLQIVRDVAPGSSLAFATAFGGQATFANNITALKNNGAKVIVDDVIYLSEPMFQDGIIAQAVDNVVAAGVSYFSSAGNSYRNAYSSPFQPGTVFNPGAFTSASGAPVFFGGTAHRFNGGPGTDVFQKIRLHTGQSFIMSFQWDSPAFSVSGSPGAQNDLDVYVFNAAENEILGGAVSDNSGGDPIEVFTFVNNTGVTADFNIMITKFSGADPGLIKYALFDFSGEIMEHVTNSGTVYGHANARGAEAVGAAAYFNTPAFGVSPPVLNSFSSSGTTPILFDVTGNRLATPDVRAKPEIVAPDGGDTTFFGVDTDGNGFPNFFGTSAAAPHAAAMAALLLAGKPSLTPLQVYASLENTAIDMGMSGFDNESGYGLIQADAPLSISAAAITNISTRGSVLTGDNVMIGGFIIEGTVPKRVLVRARGPSMGSAPFSIPGTLANPFLRIFSGSTSIAQNDNWQIIDPLCASMGFVCGGPAEISATGLDPCDPNPGQSTSPPGCTQESAILITLAPGAYTAIQSGVGGGSGIGLVEVFEVDAGASPSKLTNISTRGPVGTGDDVMIGGFIIEGTVPKRVLVRARGPSMGSAPFSIPGTLANPFLRIFSGSTSIAQNDNWQIIDPLCASMGFVCGGPAEISATGLDPCDPNPGQSTSPPGCTQESAILITLAPGAYTAIQSGVGGGSGIGLVEVFDLD